MHDPGAALAQWWSLVKPGGFLVTVVPDEDLYDQGVWPSIFNKDHKTTFTLKAGPSWSPVSFNIENLVKRLPGAEVLDVALHDAGYDYRLHRSPAEQSRAKNGRTVGRFMVRLVRSIAKRLPLTGNGTRRKIENLGFQMGVPVDQTMRDAVAQIQIVARKTTEIERRRESHTLERSYDVLGAIGAPILVVNLEGIVTWANAVATELLKVDQEPFIGQPIERALALVHRIGTDHRIEQQLRAIRPDTTVELGGLVVTRPRGVRIRLSCTARRSRHLTDEIVLLLRDITVQHENNAQYRLSAKVFEHSGEAIMITDHQDCILKVNAGFTQLTDYAAHEVVGRLPTFLNAGREPASFYEALWRQVHNEGHWNGELWHRRKSGGAYAAWCAISAVRDSDGEVDHYVSIFTDVTERKMRDEHRLYQSQHDLLTGLPNRVLLVDRFAQIAARHARHAAGIALLFIDLDGFKPFNDSHGHHVGDELLRVVAERLSESVRGSDTVSRYGGDEFVCLLDGLDDAETPQRVAMAILDALGEPIIIGSNSLHISASIGVAISRGQVPDLTLLMARADEAMYHAKRAGRGRWHLAPDQSL